MTREPLTEADLALLPEGVQGIGQALNDVEYSWPTSDLVELLLRTIIDSQKRVRELNKALQTCETKRLAQHMSNTND